MTHAALNIPGYLPHQVGEINSYLADVRDNLTASLSSGQVVSTAVKALESLLEQDPIVRMYVEEMIGQVPDAKKTVHGISELVMALELISNSAPVYNPNPERSNFFPVSTLFVYMMMTPAGQAVFRMSSFNECIRSILRAWCQYLDSPLSKYVLHEGEDGWLSPSSYIKNNLEEYIIPDSACPHWGFKSFNDFFHRQIKPECRPIAEADDGKVIISPNDGTLYKISKNAQCTDKFWIKSQPYSLKNMLGGDSSYSLFEGGTVYQSFLDGRNYHRFKSPISGYIRKIEKLDGLMFSNAESVGSDLTAGTYSQAYMACVNTRCLVFIESIDPAIGLVCFIAVGISEVSSISIIPRVGQQIGKGEELGFFSYGGSSICLVFRPQVISEFYVDTNDVGTVVGSRGAVVKAGQAIAKVCIK